MLVLLVFLVALAIPILLSAGHFEYGEDEIIKIPHEHDYQALIGLTYKIKVKTIPIIADLIIIILTFLFSLLPLLLFYCPCCSRQTQFGLFSRDHLYRNMGSTCKVVVPHF